MESRDIHRHELSDPKSAHRFSGNDTNTRLSQGNSRNDPAAGSPTATLLRLLLPLPEKHG